MLTFKKSLLPLFLLVITVLLYYFLTEGLPFTIGDDLNNFYLVIHAEWPQILKEALNPISPGWHANNIESLLSTRAFNSLIFKILYELFGLNHSLLHLFKAVLLGILVASFYQLLYDATKDRLVAFLAAFIIPFLPPVYESVSWIVEMEIVSQICIVLSFFVFFHLYHHYEMMSNKKFLISVILIILISWVGIENRETAKMIPVVLLSFLVFHKNFEMIPWLTSGKRPRIILASVFFLFVFIIPRSRPDYVNHPYSLTVTSGPFFTWGRFLRQVNPSRMLEGIHQIFYPDPNQMLAWSLGGAILWVIFLLMSMNYYKKQCYSLKFTNSKERPAALSLSILWLALSLFPFLLNLEIQRRYFMIPIIPVMFIVGIFISYRNLLGWKGKALLANISGLLGLVIIFLGFFGLIYLRRNMNKKDIIAYGAANAIYKNYTGYEGPDSNENIMELYSSDKVLPAGGYNKIKIADWDYGDEFGVESARELIKESLNSQKRVYLIVQKTNKNYTRLGGQLIADVPSLNKSFFTEFLKIIKRVTPSYGVYRFDRESVVE